MTSTRTIMVCILLVVIQACAQEHGKVVKQVLFSRNMPPWRSSMRVRQNAKSRVCNCGNRKICKPPWLGLWTSRFWILHWNDVQFQIQGNFPRLSSFYDGGSRPQFFHHFKRNLNSYDIDSLER